MRQLEGHDVLVGSRLNRSRRQAVDGRHDRVWNEHGQGETSVLMGSDEPGVSVDVHEEEGSRRVDWRNDCS